MKLDYIRHVEAWALLTLNIPHCNRTWSPRSLLHVISTERGRRGGKLHYVLRLQVTYQQQFIEPEWQHLLSPDGLLFPLFISLFLSNWFSLLQVFFFFFFLFGENCTTFLCISFWLLIILIVEYRNSVYCGRQYIPVMATVSRVQATTLHILEKCTVQSVYCLCSCPTARPHKDP